MKNTDKDKVIIEGALDDIKEEGVGLKREVAQAPAESRDADQKLQMSSGELKECNTEIATKSMKEEESCNQPHITTTESQCSGEMPALYEEGFAAYYW